MKKIGDQPGRDETGATGERASRTNGLVLVGRKELFSSKMREKGGKNDGCGKKRGKNLSYVKRAITNFWVLKSFLVMKSFLVISKSLCFLDIFFLYSLGTQYSAIF